MKTAIKLTALAVLLTCMAFVQDVTSVAWKSNNYMIVDDHSAKTYKQTAYCCYNQNAFAFWTKERGLKVFKMEESGRKVVDGKPEVTYLSADFTWMVTLRVPDEIEVQQMRGNSAAVILHDLKLYQSDYNAFVEAYSAKK